MNPTVARTKEELLRALGERRSRGPIAFVPTMGALHAGHRALMDRARSIGGTVVVSIFVNPMQFGPNEDFKRYPRTFDDDLAMCADAGVGVVFAPAPEVMYPARPLVTVDPGPMGSVLEGHVRPGHFAGVLTVVAKLFNLVRPDAAVFGQKDAQQLALIRRMVADLDMGVRIEAVPTVREPDGLAISSRNRYLSPTERTTALALARALAAGARRAPDGAAAVRKEARTVLDDAATADPPLLLDYLALVNPDTLAEVDESYRGPAVLAVAGRVGTTRLIDNEPMEIGVPR